MAVEHVAARSAACRSLAAIVGLAIWLPSPATANDADWALVTEEDGVEVRIQDREDETLPLFRGDVEIAASATEILAVLADIETHPQWAHACAETQELWRDGVLHRVMYNRTDSPWPVSDRDAILRVDVELDRKRQIAWVRYRTTTHPDRPPTDDAVRMPRLRGHYRLEQIAPNLTRVRYLVDADPAGSLPGWVARLATETLPLETLLGLRRRVVEIRGKNAAVLAEVETGFDRPAPRPAVIESARQQALRAAPDAP